MPDLYQVEPVWYSCLRNYADLLHPDSEPDEVFLGRYMEIVEPPQHGNGNHYHVLPRPFIHQQPVQPRAIYRDGAAVQLAYLHQYSWYQNPTPALVSLSEVVYRVHSRSVLEKRKLDRALAIQAGNFVFRHDLL